MTTPPTDHTSIDTVHSQFFAGGDQHIHIDAAGLLQELLDLLRSGARLQAGDRSLEFGEAHARALNRYVQENPAADPVEREAWYLARLTVNPDFQPWQRRYVALSGGFRPTPEIMPEFSKLLVQGEGPERRIERVTLPDIRQALEEHATFILLAGPGAGKTTVLRKLALDLARQRIQVSEYERPAPRLPLFVRLASQGVNEASADFLQRMWRAALPGSGDADFYDALQRGQLCILCDALNEARRLGFEERQRDWRAFARDLPQGNRLVFSCRTQDYQGGLGVQQVEIDALSSEQIQDFAGKYLGTEQGGALWQALSEKHKDLLDLAAIPYYLLMLVEVYGEGERLPEHRSGLFHQFVKRLIGREEGIGHEDWIAAGAQHMALGELAFAMQQLGQGTEVEYDYALTVTPEQVTVNEGQTVATPPETLLRLAGAANLLALPLDGGVKFMHHLLQEYFAATALVRRWAAGADLADLWRTPWRRQDMPAAERGEWDPLPPPPPTGWEETTIAAAGLVPALVDEVRKVNPALAARCLLEGGPEPAGERVQMAQEDLLARLSSVQVHLRSRIEAGLLLGRLGDPRFPVEVVNGVKVILPDMVELPGGVVKIGSRRFARLADNDERPRHDVPLAPYALARYPLTNAEYACFMAAGGYEEERYWTAGGKYWRRGEQAPGEEDPMDWWIETWERRRENPAEIDERERKGLLTAHEARNWRGYITWSEADWRRGVRQLYPEGQRFTQPRFWEDDDFNNPSQPVVGVTWYEAMAYATWLAEVSGQPYRLPSEPEWEGAAGGQRRFPWKRRLLWKRRFPWGRRWDASRLNSLEGADRVMRTTAVGAYPRGATPDGLFDLAGNVWEWTASRYARYPYNPDANLEDPDQPGIRITRGGGWTANQKMVRCAYRGRYLVGNGNSDLGFRLARASR